MTDGHVGHAHPHVVHVAIKVDGGGRAVFGGLDEDVAGTGRELGHRQVQARIAGGEHGPREDFVEVDSGEGIDVLVEVGPIVLNAVREVILDGINLGTDGHRKGRKAKQQGGQKGVRSGLHGEGISTVTA